MTPTNLHAERETGIRKEIAFEFRLAKAHHPTVEGEWWMMEVAGKIDGVGHVVRSKPMEVYPAKRQIAQFFTRATRQLRDWFNSPMYAQACKRAEKVPKLLVIPGR